MNDQGTIISKLLDRLLGPKKKLDEMQTQKLLRIYKNGFWLTWAGLLAAYLVQAATTDDFARHSGEWIIFMAINVYVLGAMLKEGIWSERLAPTLRNNTLCSMVGGAAVLLFCWYINEDIWSGVIAGVLTFALTMAVFAVCTYVYNKRHAELEGDVADDDEDEPEKENAGTQANPDEMTNYTTK